MDKLLLIDDETDVQYSFKRIFDSPEIELTTANSGEAGLELIPKVRPDLVIMDIRMGGMNGLETLRRIRQIDARLPVIMMTAYGTTQTAIEAMKLGAYDYLLKPFDVPKLKNIVFGALKAARDMRQVVAFQPELEAEDVDIGVVGRSDAMQNVFKMIGQLAGSKATVLITGESGTGKELVAKAIYQNGDRSTQPFLAINCAAIPENLLESELFGHEKGSFTGAAATRIGKFEQCNNGTIFLDEIGDMSLPTQTKILRVLQSGTFERVGGNQPIQVDVRVIAATNRPLEQAVAAKEFREDLFYRLNVMRIQLPALRERASDIRLLVTYFLRKFAKANHLPRARSISEDAMSILERYRWPGNVRELENAVLRASVVAKGDVLLSADLPPEICAAVGAGAPVAVSSADPASPATAPAAGSPQVLSSSGPTDMAGLSRMLFDWARRDPKLKILPSIEREMVINALRETRGNQVQAAKLLGITRATLRKRVEKFGIKQELSIA